jgi:hypothetical protein
MKVIIEIDLPEGQKIPYPEDILRLTSPDWISDWWHIDDLEYADWQDHDVTEDDYREILRHAKKYLDSNSGLNWETMQCYIDNYLRELKKDKKHG